MHGPQQSTSIPETRHSPRVPTYVPGGQRLYVLLPSGQ